MKLTLLAFAGLAACAMEEAEAGASSGGTGTQAGGDPAVERNDATVPDAIADGAHHADEAHGLTAGSELLQQADEADKAQDKEGPPGAHLDAPAAGNTDPVDDPRVEPGRTIALVGKGGDRIPVQLRDEGHLEQLRREHGVDNVEVQP
jgi:hypothetical protein